jgi:hypothetical protein
MGIMLLISNPLTAIICPMDTMLEGHINPDKSNPSPELYCVEIQRNQRDLSVSIVLQATCELMARREALRLFPEYKHSLVLMWAFPVRYVEVDWASGRCLVIKRNKRREVPAAVAEISESLRKKPPRLKEDGGEK